MSGFKRIPNVPRQVHAWYRHVSKADLAEALLRAVCTHTAEGCDDLDAAADEAALEVWQAIDADGRKAHLSVVTAGMRRPPDELSVRGSQAAAPPLTEAEYVALRDDIRPPSPR